MKNKIINWIKSLFHFRKEIKQTPPKYYPPQPVKATEVLNKWIVIKYHQQNICIRRSEIKRWNRTGRHERRSMARKFHEMERQGKIIFQEIEGKTVAIWKKDYGS